MARAIAKAGWPLHVWARHPDSLTVLADIPHTMHQSVGDLGRACDIVGLCLTDDSDVGEILEDRGLLTSLPPRGIVVNHGTGDPQAAATLAQRVCEQGHELLDAPVSGGRPAAERHTLTTFVGGDPGTAQRCRPVFEAFSSTIAYMGRPAAGNSPSFSTMHRYSRTSETPRTSSPSASPPVSTLATSSTPSRPEAARASRCRSSSVRSRLRWKSTYPSCGTKISATSPTRSAVATCPRRSSKLGPTKASKRFIPPSWRSAPRHRRQPHDCASEPDERFSVTSKGAAMGTPVPC